MQSKSDLLVIKNDKNFAKCFNTEARKAIIIYLPHFQHNAFFSKKHRKQLLRLMFPVSSTLYLCTRERKAGNHTQESYRTLYALRD